MSNSDDILDTTLVDRGKYKGMTWSQLLDRDIDYARWAGGQWEHLSDELVDAIEIYILEETRNMDESPWDYYNDY